MVCQKRKPARARGSMGTGQQLGLPVLGRAFQGAGLTAFGESCRRRRHAWIGATDPNRPPPNLALEFQPGCRSCSKVEVDRIQRRRTAARSSSFRFRINVLHSDGTASPSLCAW
jgi:hypothetical protein